MSSHNRNSKRFFVTAVETIAKEEGITISWFSDDWICQLQKNGITHFIYGYTFPINTASVWEIARDKMATSLILQKQKIPTVVHELFMRPSLTLEKSPLEHLDKINMLITQWSFPLVCKDNRGAGGNYVYKVNTKEELDSTLHIIWKNARGAVVSPLYDIENEYRFFILNGIVELSYKKVIPSIIGDGKSNCKELVTQKNNTYSSIDSCYDLSTSEWEHIPQLHEKFNLGWKFNLNKGAEVETISHDDFIRASKIALEASQNLNLKLCSVDIIKIKNTNEFKVLEVNMSITTEYFSKSSEDARVQSINLYKKIITGLF